MKRILLLTSAFFIILLAGCSGRIRTGIVASPSGSAGDASFAQSETYSGWILGVDGDRLLVSGQDNAELFWVSAEDATLADYKGTLMESSQLDVGMTADISYSGGILETYPSSFSGVSSITVTGRRNTLIGLYSQVFDELFELDRSLNSEAEIMVFDLAGVTNLTEPEKAAFIYLSGSKYSMETLSASYDELKDQGYLSDDGLLFPNGILIEMAVSETSREDGFEFSASKWRGVSGAVGFSECVATKSGGEWSYVTGGSWIS